MQAKKKLELERQAEERAKLSAEKAEERKKKEAGTWQTLSYSSCRAHLQFHQVPKCWYVGGVWMFGCLDIAQDQRKKEQAAAEAAKRQQEKKEEQSLRYWN